MPAAWLQYRRGNPCATGEQCDLVSESNQFLGQIGNHPFGSAVEAQQPSVSGAICAILIDPIPGQLSKHELTQTRCHSTVPACKNVSRPLRGEGGGPLINDSVEYEKSV